MINRRIFPYLVLRSTNLLFLLAFSTSSCQAPWKSQSSSIDREVVEYGAKIGTLARTVQSAALFIQAELDEPQPNVHEMQEAQVQIWEAHLEVVGPAPEELYDLHDSWTEASFHCQYITQLAVINLSGDLTSCLSEIDVIVEATEQYMNAQEEPIESTP